MHISAESLFSFPGIIMSCSWKCFPFVAAIDLNLDWQTQCGEKGTEASRTKLHQDIYHNQLPTDWIFYGIFFLSVWNSLVFLEQGQYLQKKRALRAYHLALEYRNLPHPLSSLFSPCQPMHINLQNLFFGLFFFFALSSLLPGICRTVIDKQRVLYSQFKFG